MKRAVWIMCVCACVVSFASASPAKMVLKYGHVAPPDHGQHVGALAFAKYVNEKTSGAIQIDVFPVGQLGGERSMIEQVQGGTLDMVTSTTAVLSNFVPQIVLLDLPFLWPSREVAYKVLADEDFKKIMFDLFPKRGLIPVGYTENEFRDLTNTKTDVRKPEDMQGMKIRVMESPVYLDTFRQLGTSPVPMPFPEVYSALQQGVIDAQDNPIHTSHQMKFTEVCKYATLTHHILTECVHSVTPGVWKKLTPEQQQMFRDGAELQIKINRELHNKQRVEAIEAVKKLGVNVVILNDAERDVFKKAVKPVHEKYAEKAGKIPNKPEYGKYAGMKYYDMIQEKIAQYR